MASIQALGSVSKVRGALIFVEDIDPSSSSTVTSSASGCSTGRRASSASMPPRARACRSSPAASRPSEPKDFRRGGVVPEVIVDNLELAMLRLASAGVRNEDVVRTAWGAFCFFWDPEGNPIQFYESAFVRPDADPERVAGS